MGQLVFEPPRVEPLLVPGVFLTPPVLGDLDADGDLDAIVTSGAGVGGFVMSFLNDGEGVLTSGLIMQGVPGPTAAAMHDLNGDGRPDYILAFSNMTLAFWGDGAGGFDGNATVSSGLSTMRIAVGHMDGDGLPDIVTATAGTPLFGIPARVLVHRGTGAGFVTSATVVVASDAQDLDLADVDGDGVLDVIAIVAGLAQVHRGDGAGGLLAPAVVAGTLATSRLAAGDLDGDGDVDLVLGSFSPQVQLVLNDGGGAFVPGALLAAGMHGASPALGDFDGDGVVDIVLNDSGANFVGQLVVHRGLGGGRFEEDVHVTAGGHPGGGAIALGDFDGDARLDVLTGSGGTAVFLNRTYAAGAPFVDLGHALAGTKGYPVQVASGTLQGLSPYSFRLLNGLPNAPATIVLGVSELNLPHKGGVMVPSPDLLFYGNLTDAQGAFTISGTWPAGLPAGVSLYLQWWMTDAGGVSNKAASTGLRFTTP